jgi:thymidylate synthase ThyX
MKHNNPSITARIIADSLNTSGNRLTSLVITLPRIVLAEFNTHRALSKNSASSRAIPLKKMAEQVMDNPFIPTAYQKEHKGMQGTEYFSDDEATSLSLKSQWLDARNYAVHRAKQLNEKGLTKQLCNRLLEPFMMHTIISTATEWENFIALRAHDQAEIHIQDAAYKVLDALNNSKPTLLQPGEWHIPFGHNIDVSKFKDILNYDKSKDLWCWDLNRSERFDSNYIKTMIAIARCARVSYMNFEGKDDYLADIKLFYMLKESGHMSPMEHIAKALDAPLQSGNFIGFEQYRKTIEGESKSDDRLIKHFNV